MHGDEATVSQASVSRIVLAVSYAIAKHRSEYIKFPRSHHEIQTAQQEFYQYSNFPGVIGAIDGTHIPIRNPGGVNALYFINRKNKCSINTQVSVIMISVECLI